MRIAALYDALAQLAPSPVVELNRAVAVGMAFGPEAGLELLDAIAAEPGPARATTSSPASAATCSPGSAATRRRAPSSSAPPR